MSDGIIEGTAVEEHGTDVVPAAAHQPSTLFHTDDPVEVVEKAGRVAAALKDVLRQQGMVQNIGGREHVKVEGWQTLGSMLGVVPVVVSTRELDDGWEARVEARTLDGRVVGAADAMCTRAERMWKTRDPYALRSMAQTRATSKALKGPLGFIVTLAGYEATPAEEMPHTRDVDRVGGSDVTPTAIGQAQVDRLKAACDAAGWPIGKIAARMSELGVPDAGDLGARVRLLSSDQADALTEFVEGMVA